ncbi:MAG: 2TM domain-containing protein [Candidatus Limnocylindria bacterium]
METITIDRHGHALKRIKFQRHFKLQLAIFVSVNTLLVVIFAVATLAGAQLSGQLWPWPLAVAIWGARVAAQGYAAYHTHNED